MGIPANREPGPVGEEELDREDEGEVTPVGEEGEEGGVGGVEGWC